MQVCWTQYIPHTVTGVGDANVNKNPLSPQSIWIEAHKQSIEYGPVAVCLLNDRFLQQTTNRFSLAAGKETIGLMATRFTVVL